MDKIKKTSLLEELKKEIPEYDFEIKHDIKYNDSTKDVVYIKLDNGLSAPFFTPDDYKDIPFSDVSKHMRNLLDILADKQYEIADQLLSDTFILDNVKIQLLNSNKNRSFLKDKPHFKVNSELSALFYVPFDEQGKNRGIITEALVHELNLSPDILQKSALSNMSQNMEFQYLSSINANIIAEADNIANADDMPDIISKLKSGTLDTMVVVSNHERAYGASTILCNDFIKACNQDLVILPSSVHEVMILPYSGHPTDLKDLQAIVEYVNMTEISEHDQLSDSVYLFDHKTQEISLACDKFGLVPICDDSKLTLPEIFSKKR